MLPNMGSIKRPKNRRTGKVHQDRWEIRWRDASGGQRTKVVKGPKAAAAAILRKFENDVFLHKAGHGDVTKQETRILALYEEWVSVRSAEKWGADHLRDVTSAVPGLLTELGATQVRDLTLSRVTRYRARRLRKGTSHRQCNRELGYLRTMLRWGLANEKIARNPLELLRDLSTERKYQRRIRHVITKGEYGKLLSFSRAFDAKRPHYVAQTILLMLLYGTGIRLGEARRLQWQDVDLRKRRIWIKPSKNGDARWVGPISTSLHDALRETQLRRGREAKRLAGPKDHVVLGARGRPYKKKSKSLVTLMKNWLAGAKLEKEYSDGTTIDWHSFRHSFCTDLADRGVPIQKAMALMGHKSARMVTEIYTARDALTLDIELRDVGEPIEKAGERSG